MRTFIDGQPLRKQFLANSAFKKRRLAVQITAGNRAQETAEQTTGQFRRKQHRDFASRYRTGAQAACCTLRGALADADRVGQQFALTADVIPIVALHLAIGFSDHHTAQAMASRGIAADETMAIAIDATALMCAQRGAVGVFDAGIGIKGRRFASQRQFDCPFGCDIPSVKKIEVL